MNRIKIAKELVKLAKSLVASESEMDFYDFVDFLDQNGWCFHNDYAVESPDGKKGTRYEISEYPQNLNHITPISKDEMKAKLEGLEKKYSNVVQSMGRNRNAPEMRQLSIILLD